MGILKFIPELALSACASKDFMAMCEIYAKFKIATPLVFAPI